MPPELTEEVDVDRSSSAIARARAASAAFVATLVAVDQLADERLQAGVELLELVHRDDLARRDPRLEEA